MAGNRYAPRLISTRNRNQVVTAVIGLELRTGSEIPALPIVIADEEVQVVYRPYCIVSVRVHARTAVRCDG